MTSSKPFTLFVVVFIAFVVRQISANEDEYNPVENVKVPKISNLVQFAINEHVKSSNESLTLVKISEARLEIVDGINYELFFVATNGRNGSWHYKAIVWTNFDGTDKRLTFFHEVVRKMNVKLSNVTKY